VQCLSALQPATERFALSMLLAATACRSRHQHSQQVQCSRRSIDSPGTADALLSAALNAKFPCLASCLLGTWCHHQHTVTHQQLRAERGYSKREMGSRQVNGGGGSSWGPSATAFRGQGQYEASSWLNTDLRAVLLTCGVLPPCWHMLATAGWHAR